ncbi:hypothetical protein [Dictyobacter alpinus]|nr:hypothetical protein [Dictyobacter alpinus]
MQLLTHDITQSIHLMAQEMLCAGVLLFVREGRGVLLETEEIKHLMARQQLSMYIIRLEPCKNHVAQALSTMASWLGELFKEPLLFPIHDLHEAREDGRGKG